MLAAGRSTRMGHNKLMAEIRGEPLLLRVVDAALASRTRPVLVVTGHEAERVRAALGERPVTFVHNPDFATGLSSSLRYGIAALPADIDAAIVCLGDMPQIEAGLLERLIHAFNPVEGRVICVPVWHGKRGNPVLWGRQLFAEIAALTGDVGAKHLMTEHPELVTEVPAESEACSPISIRRRRWQRLPHSRPHPPVADATGPSLSRLREEESLSLLALTPARDLYLFSR